MTNLKSNKSGIFNNNVFYGLMFAFGVLFCIAYYIACKGNGGIIPEFYDFKEHWKASAYILNGIDPFTAVRSVAVPEIGQMMENFISVPWSYLMSTIMAPGFLPYNIAQIYGMVFFIALVVFDVICLNKIFEKVFGNHSPLWIGIFILAMPRLAAVWIQGNNAIMVSSFLIYMFYFVIEDKEYVAGIFLAFAMVKPQVALLFCMPLLFRKKFKTIIVGAAIVLVFWAITLVILQQNPIESISLTLERGMNQKGDTRYAGIMNFLTLYGLPRGTVMKMSMAVGIVIELIAIVFLMRKRKTESEKFNMYIMFAVTSIVSALWMYSSPGDYVVQASMILLLISYYKHLSDDTGISAGKRIGVFALILIAYKYVDHILGFALKAIFKDNFYISDVYSNNFMDLCFLFIVFFLCKNAVKIKEICTTNNTEII